MASLTTESTAIRKDIMETARFLFLQEGFDRTTMRDISDRLSVSEAEITRFFPSTDELLEALWSER